MNRISYLIKTVVEHPNYTANHLIFGIGRFFGYREYRKFIVLTRGRTGSNMLLEMLNSHPNIYTKPEILMWLRGRSIDEILNRIYTRVPQRIKAIGFKIFYPHPIDDNTGIVWEKLKEINDLHIIHLKRRNLLKTLASIKIAHKTKVFRQIRDIDIPLSRKQIEFTSEELVTELERLKNWEDTFAEVFRLHKMIEIYYEDLVEDPKTEFLNILNFLDLKPALIHISIKKQNPEPLSELITNYNELKQKLMNTKWAYCFED